MVKEKKKNKEFNHKIINVGKAKGEYVSKYILDLEINIIAKEYRFYKGKNGKYNIPKEFYANVQYGNELKTICSILNTEGIVALDRLSDFVKNISHEAINVSKGTIVNFMKELDSKSKYIIENIKEKILNSELLHTDATTGRAEHRNT